MKRYSEWAPTGVDSCGLALSDRQDWFVAPCGTNRDANALIRSNWNVQCVELDSIDPNGVQHEVHCFGHWANGWFKIVLVKPNSECHREMNATEDALADYPILDEEDFGREEQEEADQVWANCYSVRERIEYIEAHRSQFEFRSFADLMGCIRGKYFAGYASELLS